MSETKPPESESEPLARQDNPRYPETNLFEYIDGFFRKIRAVTKKSVLQRPQESPVPHPRGKGGYKRHPEYANTLSEPQQRPLSLRKTRAELYKNIKRMKMPGLPKEILRQARERDEIARQFLKQGEVQVSLPEGGEASARFTILEPRPRKEERGKPPIVLIPGLANDLGCVDTLAQELAFEGRRVICIGFPESTQGTVDKNFADAVETSEGLSVHRRFFEKAIDKILPDKPEIDIWTFSTGGPVACEILSDEAFSGRVQDAVIINPAGVKEQSSMNLIASSVADFGKSIMNPKNLPSWVFGPPNKPQEDKNRIMKTLIGRIGRPADWANMRVKEGGSITVVATEGDRVTKASDVFNKKNKPANPQMRVAGGFKGPHMAPIFKPAELLEAVRRAQEKKD